MHYIPLIIPHPKHSKLVEIEYLGSYNTGFI